MKLKEMGAPNVSDGSWRDPDTEVEDKPALDGMNLTGEDFAAVLRSRGIEPVHTLPAGTTSAPQRPQHSPAVQAHLDQLADEARERREAEAKRLAEGAIDARTASVRAVADRLRELGLAP